jgi:hypothetical protein
MTHDPTGKTPQDADQAFLETVARYLDEQLSTAEVDQLNAQLLESAERRSLFARFCLHGQYLAEIMSAEQGALADSESDAPSATGGALCGNGANDPSLFPTPPRPGFPLNLLYLTGDTPAAAALLWLVMLFGAGMVIMVMAMLVVAIRGVHVTVDGGEVAQTPAVKQAPEPVLPPQPAMVARLLRTVDCQWAQTDKAPALGDDLAEGQRMALKAGLVEIAFQDGAKVLLQGPAEMEVASRYSARLKHGSLTATVENPLARGFEIHTPGMKFTDLGTEFGVLVREGGLQEVHVFRGKVQAEESGPWPGGAPASRVGGQWSVASGQSEQRGIQSQGPRPKTQDLSPATRHPSPILLAAHEAIRITAPDKPIERIAAVEDRFVRRVEQWNRIPLFSTGIGAERGQNDPHWTIVAASCDPHLKPQAAVLNTYFGPGYVSGSPETAQWISNGPTAPTVPCFSRWTFRTTFDLAGFDPATAKIEGFYAADDLIVGIRLNGHEQTVLKTSDWQLTVKMPLAIDRGFVAGQNTLEFVVYNGGPSISGMGLYAELKGTARRTLTLDARKPAASAPQKGSH